MLLSIINIEDLKDLNEIVTLQDQVKEVRLKDKLGEQSSHQKSENLFESVTETLEKTFQDTTKTITESSITNKKAMENLNNKLFEIMKQRGITAPYLLSPIAKITIPENSTQFKLVKDSSCNRVNDLMIHNSIPITLHDNLSTFRDTGKIFVLKGELLKIITNKNYNVDIASLAE